VGPTEGILVRRIEPRRQFMVVRCMVCFVAVLAHRAHEAPSQVWRNRTTGCPLGFCRKCRASETRAEASSTGLSLFAQGESKSTAAIATKNAHPRQPTSSAKRTEGASRSCRAARTRTGSLGTDHAMLQPWSMSPQRVRKGSEQDDCRGKLPTEIQALCHAEQRG
jgi:hypothetical protein